MKNKYYDLVGNQGSHGYNIFFSIPQIKNDLRQKHKIIQLFYFILVNQQLKQKLSVLETAKTSQGKASASAFEEEESEEVKTLTKMVKDLQLQNEQKSNQVEELQQALATATTNASAPTLAPENDEEDDEDDDEYHQGGEDGKGVPLDESIDIVWDFDDVANYSLHQIQTPDIRSSKEGKDESFDEYVDEANKVEKADLADYLRDVSFEAGSYVPHQVHINILSLIGYRLLLKKTRQTNVKWVIV